MTVKQLVCLKASDDALFSQVLRGDPYWSLLIPIDLVIPSDPYWFLLTPINPYWSLVVPGDPSDP